MFGGLGVRDVSTLSLPCFMSSIASVKDQVATILGPIFSHVEGEPEAIVSTNSTLENPAAASPKENETVKQRAWDEPLCARILKELIHISDGASRARILGVSTPEAGQWLNARPSYQLNTKLSDEQFSAVVALRLGLPIFGEEH